MSDSITPEQLYAMRRSGDCILIDIRRESDLEADGTVIPGAIRGNPESLDTWANSLPAHRTIIVYCARAARSASRLLQRCVHVDSMRIMSRAASPHGKTSAAR